MKEGVVIKSGYRIIVQSWENDADNYRTEMIDGLTRKQAIFVKDLVTLFNSMNDYNNKGIGNIYDADDATVNRVFDIIGAVVLKHKETALDMFEISSFFENGETDEKYSAAEYAVESILSELGLMHGEFFTRVLSSLNIEYFANDVCAQLIDEDEL